ncbi:hypothetical protein KY289_013276 [Solanum tuberosum]|nr:hypothetical protein KY289_013276 [Solanum tuberosum]
MDDFMNKLTVDCKYTLIGKFSTTIPKIELIRKSFILQTQLNGGVNIAHYNARRVFIDLENELDYNTVWTQQRMTIEGKLMRIQAWNPNFRPEEETPIVPIWVLLQGLPWHCFKEEFITPLLELVGKVLYLDTTSIKRTRATMAKVKVQVDLTKDRPRHIWIGLDEEDLSIGRWQSIEYENIPHYCVYCKHQGHMIGDCNFKIRDEEFKRRKELGAEMKHMNKGEQGQQRSDHKQNRAMEHEEQQHQNTKEGNNQQQPEQQKEEEWQVSRKRNNKIQEEKIHKTVWRPTSPHNKMSREQPQITAQQTGKAPHVAQSKSKTDHNQKEQVKQIVNKVNNKSTGIDSMLPIPTNLNSSYLYGVVEAEGGMDGGCQEKQTNKQEGVSKGGNLPHVMHEGTHTDHSSDSRTSATTTGQQHSPDHQQAQQQEQTRAKNLDTTKNNKEK